MCVSYVVPYAVRILDVVPYPDIFTVCERKHRFDFQALLACRKIAHPPNVLASCVWNAIGLLPSGIFFLTLCQVQSKRASAAFVVVHHPTETKEQTGQSSRKKSRHPIYP